MPSASRPSEPARGSRARAARAAGDTRDRLIDAAGEVFATRGYRGATMRAIAGRAGANLAAAHYHFGSKQALYRAVVRAHFERLEQRLAERGAALDAALARALERDDLVALLQARVRTMLGTLLEPGSVHATLMLRELLDPTPTLAFVVRHWVDPMRRDTARILSRLAPALSPDAIERCMHSVMGQMFFYLSHRAALLIVMRRRAYPPGFADEIAAHVVAFSLGGLDALVAAEPRAARRGAARRAAR
jgi:AcrR family transcriptional regulator